MCWVRVGRGEVGWGGGRVASGAGGCLLFLRFGEGSEGVGGGGARGWGLSWEGLGKRAAHSGWVVQRWAWKWGRHRSVLVFYEIGLRIGLVPVTDGTAGHGGSPPLPGEGDRMFRTRGKGGFLRIFGDGFWCRIRINIGCSYIYLKHDGGAEMREILALVFCGGGPDDGRGAATRLKCVKVGRMSGILMWPGRFRGCRCRCRYRRSHSAGSACRNSRLLGRRCSRCGEECSTPSGLVHTRDKPKRIYLNHSKNGYFCRVGWGALIRHRYWAKVCSRGLRIPDLLTPGSQR